jgi:predicted ABC-type ATPase
MGSNLIIVAGPNGAGKTTAAADILVGALAVQEFVNADIIAKGLSSFQPESVAFDAGRIMLAASASSDRAARRLGLRDHARQPHFRLMDQNPDANRL